jgi:hypothetical protein
MEQTPKHWSCECVHSFSLLAQIIPKLRDVYLWLNAEWSIGRQNVEMAILRQVHG